MRNKTWSVWDHPDHWRTFENATNRLRTEFLHVPVSSRPFEKEASRTCFLARPHMKKQKSSWLNQVVDSKGLSHVSCKPWSTCHGGRFGPPPRQLEVRGWESKLQSQLQCEPVTLGTARAMCVFCGVVGQVAFSSRHFSTENSENHWLTICFINRGLGMIFEILHGSRNRIPDRFGHRPTPPLYQAHHNLNVHLFSNFWFSNSTLKLPNVAWFRADTLVTLDS